MAVVGLPIQIPNIITVAYVPNLICIRLENANEIWYVGNCGFGGEILAQPSPASGWFFDTDMIRICTISVVDLN